MTATEIIQGSSEITNTDNDKFKDLILKLDDANQRNALVQQLENNKNAIKSEFSNVIKQMFNNNNLDKENNTVTINKNQISQEKCIMILQTYYALYYKGNNETITIDGKITETNKQQLTKIVEEFYPISDQDNNSTRKKAQAIIDAMKNESGNNTTNTVAEANTVAKVETKNTNSQAALKTTGETAKAATEAEIEESLRLQETAEKEAPATEAEAEKEAPATTENINSPANTATEAEKEESLRLQEVKTAEETAESKEDKLSQKLTEFQNTFNNSAKRTRKNRNSLYPYGDTEESKQKTTTIQKLCLAVLGEDKCKPVQEGGKFDDGFYGPRTRVAVEKLQKKLNGSKVEGQKIPEDKAFGPLTAAAAHEYITYSLKPKEEVATDQSQTTAPSAEGTPAQTTINGAEIITIKENQKNELQGKVNAKTATGPDNKNITFGPNETIVTTKSTTNPTVETHYVEKDGNMYKITESGNSVALVYDQQATDNAKKQTTNPEGELSAPKMQVEIGGKVATSISKETKFDVTKTKYNENGSDIQFTEDDWQFTADGNNYIVKYTTNENSEITKRDIYEITLDANKKTVASISKPQNMEYRAYNIINEGNKTAITQEMKNGTNGTIERKKDGSSITTETCNERGLDSETPLTVKTTMKDQKGNITSTEYSSEDKKHIRTIKPNNSFTETTPTGTYTGKVENNSYNASHFRYEHTLADNKTKINITTAIENGKPSTDKSKYIVDYTSKLGGKSGYSVDIKGPLANPTEQNNRQVKLYDAKTNLTFKKNNTADIIIADTSKLNDPTKLSNMILESKKNENINQESNKQLDAAIATGLVSQNLFETILDTKTQTKDTVKNYLHLVKFYQQKFPNSQTLDLNNKVANVLNTLPNDFDYKTIKSEITSLPKSIIQHLLGEKNNQINDNQEQAIVALFEDKTKQAPEAYKKAFTDGIGLNINELGTPAQKYIKKHMPKPIQIT